MSAEAGKYARFEFERRFLLGHLPKRVRGADAWLIVDRYIIGTRLRLRKMEPLAGGQEIYKLGRKDVPDPPDFSRVTITNIYLSAAEHAVFEVLPADQLRKRRYSCDNQGVLYSVDVFEEQLAGLILAELGFDTAQEMDGAPLPHFALREVSSDVRFTGFALAAASPEEASEIVASVASGNR